MPTKEPMALRYLRATVDAHRKKYGETTMQIEREIIMHIDKLTAECEALLRSLAFFARDIKGGEWSPEDQRIMEERLRDYYGGDPAPIEVKRHGD